MLQRFFFLQKELKEPPRLPAWKFHFKVPPTSVFLFIGIFLPVPLHPHILTVPFKKCVMKEKSYQDCILFFQLYWSVIDKYNCKIFKVFILMAWYTCALWKDSSHLVKHPSLYMCDIYTHTYIKFYSFSKFQLYNTMLSTIGTMFYIRCLDLIHFMTESLYSLTNLCLFPHLTDPGNHFLTLHETVFKLGSSTSPSLLPSPWVGPLLGLFDLFFSL